ncbi:MAG: 50S ribosomal protein L6 [Planctomycetes bacterium]|nr:50S ribosomal protein L6 [Planctomycetota bacterium]MBM4058684.1 50S ribosomal protein L6 [Planctomycetota bacterium]
MSRIGKNPVPVPKGVKVSLSGGALVVEGPLGKLEHRLHPAVRVQVDDSPAQIVVTRDGDGRTARAVHGLTRALAANMVEGVTKGYEKRLEIVGVGYLAAVQKNVLQLRVGFANELQVPIPSNITVACPDQTHVSIKGIDKQAVGQFAAEVRALRKPEPYKGKGIRYENEHVRRKAGKAVTK